MKKVPKKRLARESAIRTHGVDNTCRLVDRRFGHICGWFAGYAAAKRDAKKTKKGGGK